MSSDGGGMRIGIELTTGDLARVIPGMVIRQKTNWLVPLMIVGAVFWPMLSRKGAPEGAIEWVVLVVLFLGLLLLLVAGLLTLGWLTLLLSSRRRPGVLGAHTYEIREKGLFESTTVNETLSSWTNFNRLTVSSQYLTLREAGGSTHIFPRRCFADPRTFTDFVDAVRGHILIATEGRAKV